MNDRKLIDLEPLDTLPERVDRAILTLSNNCIGCYCSKGFKPSTCSVCADGRAMRELSGDTDQQELLKKLRWRF